ncbi:MAG: TetR/AcrR family transcriptional regulator [Actinomycetota bacterium]|nr:TetR/AcrR family transcriptional regulator [Actinomycetota bacterium]
MPPSSASKPAKSNGPLARGEAWKDARRQRLLDVADRVIRRLGPAASMDEVAREAGISRMVLYRYFGDKGGLYQTLAERYVRVLMGHLRAALASADDPAMRLEATIDAYVRFIEEHRESYDFLMHRAVREGPEAQATVADFMRSVAREVSEVLADQISGFGFDPAPADAWAHGIVGMVHLSTEWWLENPHVPRQRFVGYLVALLSSGFFGGAGLGAATDRMTREGA